MRSLKDIKKAIAKASIHVERQTDETVFQHLLRELSEPREDSTYGRCRRDYGS